MNYEIIKQRILELDTGETGEDEYGALTPTPYALKTTLQLLDTIHEKLGDKFPRGFGCVDYKGGIELEFNSLKVDINILIPYKSGESWYIYIASKPSQLVYYPTVDFIIETIQNNED